MLHCITGIKYLKLLFVLCGGLPEQSGDSPLWTSGHSWNPVLLPQCGVLEDPGNIPVLSDKKQCYF